MTIFQTTKQAFTNGFRATTLLVATLSEQSDGVMIQPAICTGSYKTSGVKNGDSKELARSRLVKLESTCGLLVACLTSTFKTLDHKKK